MDYPFPLFPEEVEVLLPPALQFQDLEEKGPPTRSRLGKAYLDIRGAREPTREKEAGSLPQALARTDLNRRVSILLVTMCSEGMTGLMGLKIGQINSEREVLAEIYKQLRYRVELGDSLTHELRLFLRDYFNLCKSNYNNYLLEMHYRERMVKTFFLESMMEAAFILDCFEGLYVPFSSLGASEPTTVPLVRRNDGQQIAKIYEHKDTVIKL
jgi:hypothetical protein